MHILLIHQYFLEKNGGGGSRFNELSRIWTELGHRVTVIAGMVHYNSGKKSEQYRGKYICKEVYGEQVTVYRCHVSEAYNTNFLGRLWGYLSFVVSSVIAGILYTRQKYDCIVVTSPPLFVGITALLLSWVKRKPFVFEVRDLWPESAIDTGIVTSRTLITLAYRFEALMYKWAAGINVLTPAFQKKLIEQKGISSAKVFMVPNAADFSIVESIGQFDREEFRREHEFGNCFVAVYVGAHGVANHLIQIVETAAKMRDESVLFVLIGEGMQKEVLKNAAQNKKISNIRFVDSVSKSDVFKYILAADAGMSVLKKCDTFKTIYSNKTFDYMSCKKPVLLAIDGVSRELVETAKCGRYIEPENSEQFSQEVRFYMDNPMQAREDGARGYTYAKEHFDRQVLGEKYIDYLARVVAQGKK